MINKIFSDVQINGVYTNQIAKKNIPASVAFGIDAINLSDTIELAKLYIKVVGSLPNTNTSGYKITYNGDSSNIAFPIIEEISSVEYLVFDLSEIFHVHRNVSTIDLVLSSNYKGNLIVIGNGSYCTFEYGTPFDYLEKQKLYELSIGDSFSYQQDVATLHYYLSKQLFNGVLPFNYSLVFDSYNPTSTHCSFFPDGWKLNVLEQLINITSSSIQLVDSTYNIHKFYQSNVSAFYYDSVGSGLIIEVLQNGNYKLFSPLISSYKVFNSSGQLVLIKLENGDEISISHSSTSITITDFRNNILSVNKVSNTEITISSSVINQTYNLTIDSNNKLTNISFSSIDGTSVQDTITYSNNDISEIVAFDNYKLLIVESLNSRNLTIKHNTIKINEVTFTKYFRYTSFNDNYNAIEYAYYIDDDHSITVSGEVTNKINENDSISCCSDLLSFVADKYSILSAQPLLFYTGDDTFTSSATIDAGTSPSITYKKVKAYLSESLDSSYKYLLIAKIERNNTSPSTLDNNRDLSIFEGAQDNIDSSTLLSWQRRNCSCYHHFIFIPGSNMNGLTFAVKNNIGTYTISNVIAIKLDRKTSQALYDGSSLGSINIDNYHFQSASSFFYYDNLIPRYLCKEDININKILQFKYGFVKYFFTDKLKRLFVFDNSHTTTTIYRSLFLSHTFETTTFATMQTIEENKKLFKVLIDNVSETNYKIKTYYQRDNSLYDRYAIFDYHNNVIEETDYSGVKEIKNYNSTSLLLSNNRIVSSLNNKEMKSSFTYDPYSRLLFLSTLIGNQFGTSSYDYYSTLNLLDAVTDAEDNIISHQYSNKYERETRVDSDNSYVNTTYNQKLYPTSYDFGGKFVFSYSLTRNLLNSIRYVYEDPQNPLLDFSLTLMSISMMHLTTHQTTYTYTYATSFKKKYTYDRYSRLVKIDNPDNNNLYCEFTYGETDNQYSDAKLNQIEDTWGNETETTLFEYNSKGFLFRTSKVGFVTSVKRNVRDSDKRLSEIQYTYSGSFLSDFISNQIIYDYTYEDIDDSVTSVRIRSILRGSTLIDLSEHITKDDLNRLHSNYISIGSYYLGFDSVSYYLTSSVYPELSQTSTQPISVTYKQGGTTSYTYDKVGNILSISSTNTNSQSVTYQYDSTYRLTKETHTSEGYYIDYTYDINGNILSAVKKDLSNNVISSDTFTFDNTIINRMSSYNNVSISYDNYWSPLSLNGATLTYDRGNLLSTYTKNNVTTTYKYNGFNLRTFKQVGSTVYRYILDGSRIISETKEQLISPYNKTYTIYLYGLSGVIGMIYNGDKYLYEKDIQGNVLAIYKKTLTSLTLQAKYSYDAYGNHQVLNPDGTVNTSSSFIGNINPFRYRSYYYDNETGFYYCQSRYYVPYLRRWLTIDDLSYLDNKNVYGCNLYAYCNDNPVMYKDESGHDQMSFEIIKQRSLFGGQTRFYDDFIDEPNFINNGFLQIGFYERFLKVDREINSSIYFFSGSSVDVMHITGLNSFAGLGINFGENFSFELQVDILGLGFSVNIGSISFGIDLNLLGASRINASHAIKIGENDYDVKGFTIGVNTYAIISIIAFIFGVATGQAKENTNWGWAFNG